MTWTRTGHVFISSHDARAQFGLSRPDLAQLRKNSIVKECPFGGDTLRIQYPLDEVVALAKEKLGDERILAEYERHLRQETQDGGDAKRRNSVFGYRADRYWYSAPSTSTVEGRESVRQGLVSNSMICCVKSVVWFYTGSHAIFADLMHSVADVANYGYRLLELRRSSQTRDHTHPYGYAPLRYITADRSFVILGGLGCIVPFWASASEMHAMLNGSVVASALTTDMLLPSAVVFGASMVLEGLAVRTAYHEILGQAKAMMTQEELEACTAPWMRCARYLKEGPDIMSVATLCEASSGVVGAGVGLGGLALSWYFETAIFDVGASLIMASSVGAVAGFLMQRSGSALLGRTLPTTRMLNIVERLQERPTVEAVYDVKTEVLGTDTVRFKAEVQFNAEAITESILGIGRPSSLITPENITMAPDRMPEKLETQLQEILPKLRNGFSSNVEAENWLHENNALFYEALAWEIKMTERQIRADLQDFRNVHIDLEPW